MNIKQTGFEDLIEIEPTIYSDDRGYFFEAFNQNLFSKYGLQFMFVQDNQSFSKQGVIRGLHLQLPPYAQGKLVRVISGKALDVVVDVRPKSKTFGQHYKSVLDSEKNNMMYVPEGFAHGFKALTDCLFFYKCTNFYNKESESGIIWNDPDLKIDWQIDAPEISEKDRELPSFRELQEKIS